MQIGAVATQSKRLKHHLVLEVLADWIRQSPESLPCLAVTHAKLEALGWFGRFGSYSRWSIIVTIITIITTSTGTITIHVIHHLYFVTSATSFPRLPCMSGYHLLCS